MKNILKKAISVLLIAVMVLCSAPLSGFVGLELPEIGGLGKFADSVSDFFAALAPKAKAATSGTCGDDLTWTFDESTGELVISGTGDMYDFGYGESPWYDYRSSIKTVIISDGVTSIGDYAFDNCYNLTSIIIPDGVTSIGDHAFDNCYNLTSITIPEGVTSIGYGAFSSCDNLTSITIPDSVKSIGSYAFDSCGSLVSIKVDSANIAYSSDDYGVLFNKDKTELIQYPIGNTRANYVIPDSVTSIGGSAFEDCSSLTSVTIPDSVTSIDGSAFEGCTSLTSITIPGSVTSIGRYEFSYCTSLTSITIPDSVTIIDYGAFYGCEKLESITIPDSVTIIYDSAFHNCFSLTSITIPDSVTIIGESAFAICTNLTSVIIPNSVKSISPHLFYGCEKLESITIPDSVTSIGDDAFYRCESLTSIKVDSANIAYSSDEYGVLFNKDKTILIQYPAGNTRTNYAIPDSVTNIGDSAFSWCESLESVTIPDSVTSIGDDAFYRCTSLTSITIPDSVTSIDYCAFYGCEKLESITIPSSVKSVDESAFASCFNLADVYYIGSKMQWDRISVYFDNEPLLNANIHFSYHNIVWNIDGKVTTQSAKVGDAIVPPADPVKEGYTFAGWSPAIPEVMPENDIEFTAVWEEAISNMSGTCGDNLTWTFDEATGTLTISGTGEMYDWESEDNVPWFNYNDFIITVTISEGITSIGGYAFYSCDNLTSITIPDSVTNIGECVFNGCENLESINVDPSNTSYSSDEYGVLFNKDKTELIYYPEGITAFCYVIPKNVVNVAQGAFLKNESLTSLVMLGNITTVYDDNFSNSNTFPNLKTLVISDTLEEIYGNSFDCTVINEIYYTGTEQQWIEIENKPTYNNIYFNFIQNLNLSFKNDSEEIHVNESKRLCFEESYKDVWEEEEVPTLNPGNPDRTDPIEPEPSIVQTFDRILYYNSSDNNIVTVSDSGIITGISEGVAIITGISISGITTSCTITVLPETYQVVWNVDGVETVVSVKAGDAIALPETPVKEGYTFAGWTPAVPEVMPEQDIVFTAVWEEVISNISGTCGDNLTWTFDESTGTLTISGTGEMTDWTDSSETPWNHIKDIVKDIVIENGVTSIGDNAFNDFSSVESVTIPKSVTNIGDGAFGTSDITDVYYEGTEEEWNEIVNAPKATNIHYNFVPANYEVYISEDYIELDASETGDPFGGEQSGEIIISSTPSNLDINIYVEDDSIANYGFQRSVGEDFYRASVNGVSPGETYLVAETTYEGVTYTAKCKIRVVDPSNYEVYISEDYIELDASPATADPFSGEYRDGIIISSNVPSGLEIYNIYAEDSTIAMIGREKRRGEDFYRISVTGGSPGETYLVAETTYEGVTYTAKCKIKVVEPTDDPEPGPGYEVPSTCVMTFDSNGGTTVVPIVAAPGTQISIPEDPVKEGYTFTGWYPELPESMPTQDMTFTATWEVNTYEITWNVDGETTTTEYDFGAPIELPAIPQKEHYTFVGWTPSVPETMPAHNLIFTATWNGNFYQVKWIIDDNIYNRVVTYGDSLVPPEVPEKEGYDFIGWYDENDNECQFPTTVQGDAVYRAKYTLNKEHEHVSESDWMVTVEPTCVEDGLEINYCSYVFADGTVCGEQMERIIPALAHVYSILISREEPTCIEDGFIVCECAVCGSRMVESISPVPDNHTPGEWEIIKEATTDEEGEKVLKCVDCEFVLDRCVIPVTNPYFMVTFDASTGEFSDGNSIISEKLRAGDAIATPESPVKEGYTFAGWTPAVPEVMPEADMVFTATWTVNKYKVKWNIDGMTMSQNITFGAEIPVPDDPEKEGYEFAGWTPAIPETMPAENVTFTATWKAKEYIITWVADGVETKTAVAYGETITVPENPVKDGHTFVEWIPAIPETMPATDLTFNANFIAKSYYVTWIVDGAATISNFKCGEPIILPEPPTKEGFKFAGWTPSIPATMPGYDMAFVATWEIDYNIDFSFNTSDIEIGEKTQIEIVISPEPSNPLEITWSSSDESVAKVDQNGIVTGVSCGSAVITVEVNGKTAFVTVNVAHKYTAATTEATCTQNGFTTYTCSVCGDVYTDNVVEAKGHLYSETVVDSSCTGSGYTQYECSVCGHTYTDNETPAAGHKYDAIVIKPTCTSGGYTINMCSVCGQAYKSDEVDALGHNYSERVVEATCVSGGYTEHSCLNCGDSYKDNIVEVGEHNYVATKVVEATCTVGGYTEYTCSVCNDSYTGDNVEALGHTITSVTHSATCTVGGYTINVCNVCNNYTSITNQTEALGHEYIAHVVPSKCEEIGYTEYTCIRGDHFYVSDETPAIGHMYEAVEIVATCIQNGYTLNICLNCGRVNKSNETLAYGHSFNDWKTVTEAGENIEGLQTRSCKNCGYTEEKIIPMLQRTTYTATFVADGNVVSYVEFLKGTTEITEPEVPQKNRYSGKWEAYTLTDSDIVINAEYTLIDLDDLSGIDFGKNASYNPATGEATISLYASSEAEKIISQTSKKIPLDIVLVVDQSGSMADKLGGKISKQDALIASANDFVNSVYADASANGVDHRIAVVGFGMGNKSNGFAYPAYLNTEILTTGGKPVNMKDAKASDYASALMPVNADGAINANIVNAINSIDANGATAADFGLSMACNVFANNTDTEGRQRIVVFMTDGEPTYNSGYEVNVANAAVQQAHQLKNTYDAYVYSVGIFDETEADEYLVKFMNHVSSNCKTARSAPGNFEMDSDKFYLTVDNTDGLSDVFTEIVVENITMTTDFDNITLIDTVSKYFALTSQQEKALRISAIEKFGVKNSDITVTRNEDGTTTIEIKSIHPEEIGDKFVVSLDFAVSANENASVAGNYATNTEDAGIIVGDAENYECVFNAPSINIPADRNTVVFRVNGDVYAIKSVTPGGKITAPTTDFIGDYKFTGWNIPAGTVANQPRTEFDSALVNQDCVVIWNTDNGSETVTYAPGDVVDVPDVAPDKTGMAFRRWNGEVPVTMPAESLEFTAVYGDHEHKYTAEIIKAVTCLEDGETKYTCSICEGTYTETVKCAGEHTWKAITGPADKNGHTPETFKCEACGVSDDKTLEYMLLNDEDGNIMQEFNYVDENGNACQPDGELTISVPLEGYEGADTVNVYRLNGDGTRTQCESRYEYGVLEFDTDHFSTYIFEPVYQCVVQGNHPDSNNDGNCDVCRKWLGVTVTWVVDGKETNVKANPGTELEEPATPVKEGYTFVGWTPAVPEFVPETNVTFTAVFKVNEYTVKWVVDGKETTETYEYGSEITVPVKPSKDGYFFSGWTPSVPSKMPAKNMTFKAKFTDYDASKIKVTIATPETRTVSYRESIVLYASANNLPDGAKIKWSTDSNDVSLEVSSDGRRCTVTSVSNGNVVISAYLVDANGNVITNEKGVRIADYEGITSEVTLWSMILHMFKQLFAGNPIFKYIFRDLFD